MADLAYRNEPINPSFRRHTDWGAIWAGVFVFMAIWSVFGALGFAIFSSAANSNATSEGFSMNAGMGIWAIVLTIVAMYVAGRETGHLARVDNRYDGLIHGLVMFGLSTVAVIILAAMGSAAYQGTGAAGSVRSPYLLSLFSGLGWYGFLALFLGWLAAILGASSGVSPVAEQRSVREIRPAA